MSILDDDLQDHTEIEPVTLTLTGEAGSGKTTLACTFPNPIYIPIEDGLKAVPVDNRPKSLKMVKTPEQLFSYLGALVKEQHEYKTLILDSITQLDSLFTDYVVSSDPKKPKSINQALGGYGAGMEAVSALHGRVRKACGILSYSRGMNIVFIAHSEVEKLDLPDEEPYSKYNIKMGKRSANHYIGNVDLVGHIKLDTYVMEKDGSKVKKAVSDGSRVLVTYLTAANVSKNRYGITEDLPVKAGENPLVPFIKALQ